MLWLTWERHVRNRTLSARLNAQLVEVDIAGAGRINRYFKATLISCRWLWLWRRKIVVTQNPSLVLSLLAVILKSLLGYRLIVDAHNVGIYPAEGQSPLLQLFANIIIRFCDYVIVTNQELANRVTTVGGHYLILPDPIPTIHQTAEYLWADEKDKTESMRVVFICTWASDEPFYEVFKAAELLPHVKFWVTGNSRGREAGFGKAIPFNVVLTGFIPEETYHQLLYASKIIIDLTTRENCLLCGAYEAVAVGRPFLLSDTQALRTYFRKGGCFCLNQGEAIAAGLVHILENYSKYLAEVSEAKHMLEFEWLTYLSDFEKKIEILASGSAPG